MALSDAGRSEVEFRGDRSGVFSLGNISLNLRNFRVAVEGKLVELSYHELELLKLFLAQPDYIISYDQLMSALWGNSESTTRRGLNVLVCRLRAKLAGSYPYVIETVRGRGYGLLKTPHEERNFALS
jgi:DNA-binding response OmpR family regulator